MTDHPSHTDGQLPESIRSYQVSIEQTARDIHTLTLRLERLEIWIASLKDRLQGTDADVKLLSETLSDVQQASARLCEWARVKETLLQKEEQQLTQTHAGFVARFQALETRVSALLRDKERALTWTAGAVAGYAAWRGIATKDLLDKFLGLFR